MPSESDGAPRAPLPAELIPDFERFRAALGARAAGGGACGVLAGPSVLDGWREYGRLLHAKSASLALVAKGDRNEIFTRHVQDSLNPVSLLDRPPASVLDIGSGGGLPGIPLAIAWPGTDVVLLESRERKAGFLEQTVRALELRRVEVICARLEDVASRWTRDPVECAFVRAVGDLPRILSLASAVCRPGGRWIYFLGSRDANEALSPESGFQPEVAVGAFGGRLLVGSFPGRV